MSLMIYKIDVKFYMRDTAQHSWSFLF